MWICRLVVIRESCLDKENEVEDAIRDHKVEVEAKESETAVAKDSDKSDSGNDTNDE